MLILASKSPARKALLAGAGLRFETSPARIDERALEAEGLGTDEGATALARRLAAAKALDVSLRHPGALVIGADQTLDIDGVLLHKPANLEEAAAQLARLSGRHHHLNAGVALARDGVLLWEELDRAELVMRRTDATERAAVLMLEGMAILDCVGAYRLEGPSIRLFEQVRGDYFTILGLPMLPLLAALRRLAPDLLESAP